MKSDRSFSIVDEDDDFTYNLDDQPLPDRTENARNIFSAKRKPFGNIPQVKSLMLNDNSDDSDDHSLTEQIMPLQDSQSHIMTLRQTRIPSAGPGPSGRQTVTKIRPPIDRPPTDSDSDHSEDDDKVRGRARDTVKSTPVGEYDPTQYEHLQVSEDIQEIFQYITKYVPQQLNLDLKFRPFIPDFLPAVGDIDAFLKVVPPEHNIGGEPFQLDQSHLGLTVLDEPAAYQSDPALLHLQLRAQAITVPMQNTNMIVKKVSNVEKESKTVDKWIKDITDLHKTKSSPVVKYSNPMPDLDDLMQQWPENMENMLKLHGFPLYSNQMSLSQYIDIVANMFDIPVYKNKIQSLHVLFSLYAAVKSVQRQQQLNPSSRLTTSADATKSTTDQLVLD